MLHRSRSYRRHGDDSCALILLGFGLVINTGRHRSARYSVSCLFCRRCPLATSVYCEKTAESIQMPSDVLGRVEPRSRVLDGRAHQCHLANTVKQLSPIAMSGDAACFQITLDNIVYLFIIHSFIHYSFIRHGMSERRPQVINTV